MNSYMNIVLTTDQFNINNVFFQEAIKNNIINESNFIRIIYSDEIAVLNGVCIEFTLPIINIDKFFNKFKCNFDKNINREIIQKMCKIENDIIMKCESINNDKKPIFRISEQFKNGYIKFINLYNGFGNTNNAKFLIKIYGIWSTDVEYGLTYKITLCGKPL